jgi:phage terminase small subunit
MPQQQVITDVNVVPSWGPKMLALANDKQRAFVCALFDAPPKGKGALIYAAQTAGYGTSTSSRKSLGVIGSRLAMDDRVQEAIAEESHKRLRLLPPAAISALERLIRNPAHKDHARSLAMVLDRSDPLQTTHTVRVEDTRPPSIEATQKVLDRIEELMRRAGLAPKSPVIDGDFKIVGEETKG